MLPDVQYGDWKTVKQRSRRLVSRLAAGEAIDTVVPERGFLDVSTSAGYIQMHGPQIGSTSHFYVFMPWRDLWDALFEQRSEPTVASPIEEGIFAASLETHWGVLGLIAHDNQRWLIDRARHAPFLHAALRFWPELDAIGERYYSAVQPKSLWATHNNLHYVLANMGVPTDVLRGELPAEGPRALLRYAKPLN